MSATETEALARMHSDRPFDQQPTLAQDLLFVNQRILQLESEIRHNNLKLSGLYARRAQVVRNIVDRLAAIEQAQLEQQQGQEQSDG